jgi:hypothetical protein
MGLYQYWTWQLYGFGHITYAAEFSSTVKLKSYAGTFPAIMTGLSFVGGGTIIPLAFAPLTFSRRFWLPFTLLPAALFMLLRTSGMIQASSGWLHQGQLLFFVSAGILVLYAAVETFLRERDAGSLLLLCWIVGVFVFATVLNPFVAGRYLLPLVPAVAILFGKKLAGLAGRGKRALFIAGLAATAGIALLVANADHRYANAVRTAARSALQYWGKEEGRLYFQGHWGLQYYLEEAGGTALLRRTPQARNGDLIVTPSFGTNVILLNSNALEQVAIIDIQPLRWMSAFNDRLGAGFHSSLYGQLPYAFGVVTPDYLLVQRAINLKPQ